MPRWTDADVGQDKGQRLRNIRNFWSCLSQLETIQKDPAFDVLQHGFARIWRGPGHLAGSVDLQRYSTYFGTIADFNQRAKDLNLKSHCRLINKLAMKKIATILGVPPDKLYVRNPSELGQKPAIFGVR